MNSQTFKHRYPLLSQEPINDSPHAFDGPPNGGLGLCKTCGQHRWFRLHKEFMSLKQLRGDSNV